MWVGEVEGAIRTTRIRIRIRIWERRGMMDGVLELRRKRSKRRRMDGVLRLLQEGRRFRMTGGAKQFKCRITEVGVSQRGRKLDRTMAGANRVKRQTMQMAAGVKILPIIRAPAGVNLPPKHRPQAGVPQLLLKDRPLEDLMPIESEREHLTRPDHRWTSDNNWVRPPKG
jgi:hypothetical protein